MYNDKETLRPNNKLLFSLKTVDGYHKKKKKKSIFQLHSITQRAGTSVTLTAMTDVLLLMVTFRGFT